MGMAEFLENRMKGEEICVSLGQDAETVTFDQYWTSNREFFQGKVACVQDGVLELEIAGQGSVWIACSEIQAMWRPGFNYYRAVRATVTGRPQGGRRGQS